MPFTAGPELQDQSNKHVKKHGNLKIGQVVVTGAGNLACQIVLHTVVPQYKYGDDTAAQSFHKLRDVIVSCLKEADNLHLTSMAIPAVGSGASGYPNDLCCRAIVSGTS